LQKKKKKKSNVQKELRSIVATYIGGSIEFAVKGDFADSPSHLDVG
jgi:hypothetical protein